MHLGLAHRAAGPEDCFAVGAVCRSETHVISAIVHIGHDTDEDWPIQIEDHDGAWHNVALEEGQMLMYESALPCWSGV